VRRSIGYHRQTVLGATLIGVLAAQEALAGQSSTNPTLIVEVVDSVYAALPGATVTVVLRANHKQQYTATTDKDGIARFVVARGAEYEIEARAIGFKKGGAKSVFLGYGVTTEIGPGQSLAEGKLTQAPPPRVQIRLTLSSTTTVF
jgi:hypothetical protein